MHRAFVGLAAAMGMLTLSGCGEVQGGGVAAAPNTAALKPLPPAPEDKNVTIAPPPLTPRALPPAGAPPAGGQQRLGQPEGQPASLAPPATALAADQPATGPSSGPAPAAPPVAAPSNGGGLLQSLFGDTSAAKTPTPDPTDSPNIPESVPRVQIALSNASVGRIDKNYVHFEASYAFTQGRPNVANVYAVFLANQDDRFKSVIRVEKNYLGKDLPPNGKFEGTLGFGGQNPTFEISVTELIPPGYKRVVSNVVTATVGRDAGHAENGASLRPAVAGVGAQGKGYGAGIVTTPVAAFFGAKEKITFDQITRAMKFFNGQNNRNPSSQEEFMEKIVKDNGLTLPELPAGERYIYDPQAGELMVEHPKK